MIPYCVVAIQLIPLADEESNLLYYPIRDLHTSDVDRNNVPVARSNGLEKDLSLTGTGEHARACSLLAFRIFWTHCSESLRFATLSPPAEYPTLLSLLYVGYILFQIPSNMIVRRNLQLEACAVGPCH